MAGEAAYLDKAIGRYSPDVAAIARAAMKKLRARFPGARVLVFERRGSLPIGFAPAERGSPVFSIVVYPRWVRFFFLEGVALDDPDRRLEGTSNQVDDRFFRGSLNRSIRLDEGARVLDDPYIRGLVAQALKAAGANLKTGEGRVVLRTTLTQSRLPG